MASDDWRVTVTLHDEGSAGTLGESLQEHELEEEARARLGGRVIVGGGEDDGVIFLYTDTSGAAHEAQTIVQGVLAAEGVGADYAIDRWHPVEERWEPEGVALPVTEAELEAERDNLEADEVAQSREIGSPLWEVRVELASHRDAEALAERLESDYSVIRRWTYLLVGAESEDGAKELAAALQADLPAGATLHVEPSGALVWQQIKPSPFAVLGGLSS
jgi:hypothetical protein